MDDTTTPIDTAILRLENRIKNLQDERFRVGLKLDVLNNELKELNEIKTYDD